MSEGWPTCPMVVVPQMHCPRCLAVRPIVVRTMPAERDGSVTRRCVCSRCSARFLWIIEPPEELLPEELLPAIGSRPDVDLYHADWRDNQPNE